MAADLTLSTPLTPSCLPFGLVARRWAEFAPVDASKATEHRKLCATLASTSDRLTAASNKQDASAVASAFGEIAAQLSKLRDLNPPPPTGGVWT